MTPRQVAENYWRIECTRDVDEILRCYGTDAELVVPELGRLAGHDEIRRFYQASVDRFPDLSVAIVGAVEQAERGAFEWRAEFRDRAGAVVHLTGVNVIAIESDRFRSVHVYFNPADLETAATGAAA